MITLGIRLSQREKSPSSFKVYIFLLSSYKHKVPTMNLRLALDIDWLTKQRLTIPLGNFTFDFSRPALGKWIRKNTL